MKSKETKKGSGIGKLATWLIVGLISLSIIAVTMFFQVVKFNNNENTYQTPISEQDQVDTTESFDWREKYPSHRNN